MKEKEEIKDLYNIKPIDHGTIAKPHTPVYKMHRYFARRPYSVFQELIKHYSNPGSIILDPFCGGGVTVVEGLKLKRKVIGVDINPMATFITRMEVIDVDLEELQKAFEEIEAKIKDEILELYMTKCPECKKETPAVWIEWSYEIECPFCENPQRIDSLKKMGRGRYKCSSCGKELNPLDCNKIGTVPIMAKINCDCKFHGVKIIETKDIKKLKQIEQNFSDIIRKKGLYFPEDEIPPSIKIDKWAVRQRGFTHFYKFFTKTNLLALSILFKAINEAKDSRIKDVLLFTFSSMLYECACFLCHIKNKTVVKPGHHFWIPNIFASNNVWMHFERRYKAVYSGKKFAAKEINRYFKEAQQIDDLNDSKTCWLITGSATLLPFGDNSVDAIITDPPYGDNVNYAELSNIWAVWLKDRLKLRNCIDVEKEIVINSMQKKGIKEYRNLLNGVFQECHRVLKNNRWMVMTFHNREFKVWNAIHLAAHDAGFVLSEEDGMIYQTPIQAYVTTLHQQTGGSMLGDFILSFQKATKLPEKKIIPYVEVEKKIQELAAEAVLHHHGASLSTIYMKIMPFLLNNNLLDKIGEKDLAPYLKDSFEERDGKWYLKENIGDPLRDYLSDYSKSHYKEDYKVLDFVPVEARLEYLIRRKLYSPPGYATQDEILNVIYSNLINSNAAEYGEISRVLSRIAKLVTLSKGKRKVWRLREDIEREKQLDLMVEKVDEISKASEESEHDLMIRRLVDLGEKEGFSSHIGRTEQKKYIEFRNISIPMANNTQYGISQAGFRHVTEIDVLWLKGDAIVSAFEVEKTTTIDSGINRFRNLFASQPNVSIEAYLVVPDKRKSEVERKLKSPANIKDSLTKKIGYILFGDLDTRKEVAKIDFNKIKNWVNL